MGLFDFIGGVANTVATGVTSKKDRKAAQEMQRQSNIANLHLSNLGYERDVEMWKRNNLYNSPKEQMNRLTAAGLNPNLVYGKGAVGNTSGQTPKYNVPRHEPLPIGGMNFGSALQGFQDWNLKKAQTNNVEAATLNTTQDTAVKIVDESIKNVKKLQSEFNLKKDKMSLGYQMTALGIKNKDAAQSLAEKLIRNANLKIDGSIKEQELHNRKLMGTSLGYQTDVDKTRSDLAKRGMFQSDNYMLRKMALGQADVMDYLFTAGTLLTPGLGAAKSLKALGLGKAINNLPKFLNKLKL